MASSFKANGEEESGKGSGASGGNSEESVSFSNIFGTIGVEAVVVVVVAAAVEEDDEEEEDKFVVVDDKEVESNGGGGGGQQGQGRPLNPEIKKKTFFSI